MSRFVVAYSIYAFREDRESIVNIKGLVFFLYFRGLEQA